MGAKESKPGFLTYEEASRRVSDAELKRLKDAFKRASTLGGYMTKILFTREVLGDGVPLKLAELVFEKFGGSSKGLVFKDLLIGLVLITRGRQEEKLKFLFSFYADATFSHVLKPEMDQLVLATEGLVPEALSDLFLDMDTVSYDQFKSWLLRHKDVTSLTKWLLDENCTVTLSNDSETPTFYQTLAGVTHLEEGEILELEKRYWVLKGSSRSGRFDLETFQHLVCPPLPEDLCQGVFDAFDENRDNHIDFKEIACGISACCKGPKTERQKFCFKIFDKDQDGFLSRQELQDMICQLLAVSKENHSVGELENRTFSLLDPELMAAKILEDYASEKCQALSPEEYLVWTISQPLAGEILDLLCDISHIILGLKPSTREEEGNIVKNWLAREDRRSLRVGQTWYLISMQWWRGWYDFVTYKHQDPVTLQPQSFPSSPSSKRSGGKKQQWSPKAVSNSPNLPKRNGDDAFVVVTTISGGTVLHEDTFLPSHPDKVLGNGTAKSYTLAPPQANGQNSGSRSRSPSPKLHKRSVAPYTPTRPTAIDNNLLISYNGFKGATLTNEGGRLRRNLLTRGRDFELVPESMWKALQAWYGGSPALPRTVINTPSGPELELYPVTLKLLKYVNPPARPPQANTFTGMMTGIGGFVSNTTYHSNSSHHMPRKSLAHTATFSKEHTLHQILDFLSARLRINREDMRLWKYEDDQNMSILDDEAMTVEAHKLEDNQQVLIEVRNKDLTWPEEMAILAKNKDKKQTVQTERGCTGLNNLGNTCFLNSAIQCVSNTRILTLYFTGGMHLYELNRSNALGMKGHIAQRYGELVKDLWSGTSKATAPLKLRWTIGKYASQFMGFQQHDSQELLAFLLDGLHEDLNRVHDKPYAELKDSDGRPDEEVAMEAWENHLLRNRSVVVDLFHGQLKSQVRCMSCGHISVRFDPFTFLSLPLPMESCIHVEVIVFKLDGSVPIKYGLRLNTDGKYKDLKSELSSLSNIPTSQLLLAEIFGAVIKSLPANDQKIRTLLGGPLYAYELPKPIIIHPESVVEEKDSNDQQQISRNETRRVKDSPVPPGASHTAASQQHTRSSSEDSVGSCAHNSCNVSTEPVNDCYIVGIHRKMFRMDNYFLSSQKTRPSLFGIPLILPCNETTTHQDLYKLVWTLMSRLISPLPTSEGTCVNHAQDCDDSLGYEYPFSLTVVQKDGFTCAWCPWYRFCRGCRVNCDTKLFLHGSAHIAVDWDPTAVHLRYQSSQERVFVDHDSVAESDRLQCQPIDLDACLKAFTKEEQLGEDELYYCSKCKEHRLAAKKLDIWKLPPVLIIHLKRFQFVNGHWVKSQKIVNFPKADFDPSMFVAQRTSYSNKICCSDEIKVSSTPPAFKFKLEEVDETSARGDSPDDSGCVSGDTDCGSGDIHDPTSVPSKREEFRKRYLSIGDYDKARYEVYAVSCHSGIMGGGHYVSYAKNPNEKWYYYNDSSCKEVNPDQIDTTTAYMVFYERKGLDYGKFMPNIRNKDPDTEDIDDEFESEFKKMCNLQ